MLQSLEPGARRRVESPLPARYPRFPWPGRKPAYRLAAPEVCLGPFLATAPIGYPGAREMSERSSGWSRKFEEPIALADGRRLVTLHDAATYITALPDEESSAAEWQAAIEALILVAETGGPTMLARIGVMRALNRGHVREFNSSGKTHHWGWRKLKREE
jgi:hypothetical protein